MKVKDYYNDMVLNQKWAIEVEEVLVHNSLDSDKNFVESQTNTIHYSVPFKGKCEYLSSEVCYFRIVHDEIVLCIQDISEV